MKCAPHVVTGRDMVGGLVGFNEPASSDGGGPIPGGSIMGSSATGDVNGATNAGGLVGVNAGTINGSRATGSVNDGGSAGGLVGSNSFTSALGVTFAGTITNSTYHDVKAEAAAAAAA